MIRTKLLAAVVVLVSSAPLHAQSDSTRWQRFLPHIHYFRPLVADLQEPRLGLALLQTNVFKYAGQGRERPAFSLPDPKDSEFDVEIAAAIGGSLPLWQFKEWPGKGGIVASAQLGVFPRFRIEYPTRIDAGEDWFVGMPIEVAYERWSGRFRIMHRSSHLGDELIEVTGAQRIEFGGEFADFLAAYRVADDLRVYGGATYNFRSYTEILPALRVRGLHDYGALQAGVDGTWYRWSGGHAGFTAGVDWQAQQRTNWRSIYAFAAGPALRSNGRATRLLVRHYRGPSAMGEFFMTPEKLWSIEWVVDF
ncbi:MAG TPA: DUF1207 domain-containing protein [Longimicrobiales bacterium]